jgi:hypothetical protein
MNAEALAGVVLAAISFALTVLARVQLGKSFAVIPKANGLVKHGLYSRLQHPIYVSFWRHGRRSKGSFIAAILSLRDSVARFAGHGLALSRSWVGFTRACYVGPHGQKVRQPFSLIALSRGT